MATPHNVYLLSIAFPHLKNDFIQEGTFERNWNKNLPMPTCPLVIAT